MFKRCNNFNWAGDTVFLNIRGKSNTVVPDFTISVNGRSYNYLFFGPYSSYFAFSLNLLVSPRQDDGMPREKDGKRRENKAKKDYMNCHTQKLYRIIHDYSTFCLHLWPFWSWSAVGRTSHWESCRSCRALITASQAKTIVRRAHWYQTIACLA